MNESFPIPLNALRAIEVVARAGALGPAAEELGVTPGAVSQHIRRAEERLGVALFDRTPQGLVPTAELELVRPQLRQGFQALMNATRSLAAVDDRVLTMTVGNVFSSRWLVWRLPRFSALVPDVELRFIATGKIIDPARPDIDCCIRFGTGPWPDTRAEPLGGQRFMPVCTPELAARLQRPEDLVHVPVIEDRATMLSWHDWMVGAGMVPQKLKGPSYTDPALAFDAAEAGQGVLMAVDLMAADALAMRRLVKPFDYVHESALQYWFVTDKDRHMPNHVRLLADWMKNEIAETDL